MFPFSDNSDSSLVSIADGLPSDHRRQNIPDGVAGTAATITLMQKGCSLGKREIKIRKLIGKLLNGEIDGIPACRAKDYLCYAKSAYLFCRDHIKYVYDPTMVEYVERPDILLETRVGDCDSVCTLLCSIWESMGFDAEYVTIKADPQRPDEFSHVYARVNVPGYGWINADPTMPAKTFGWEAEGNYPKRYWHASTDDLALPLDTSESIAMSGLGCPGKGKCKCENCSTVSGLGAFLTFDSGKAAITQSRVPLYTQRQALMKFPPPRPVKPTAVRPTKEINGLGMGRLGADADPGTVQAIKDIMTGDTYAEIVRMRNDYQGTASDLDDVTKAVNAMQPGPDKDAALQKLAAAEESLRQQFVLYRTVRDNYNDFVTKYKPYFFGVWNPSLAGLRGRGMGAIGLDDAAIAIALIVAAAFLVSQITNGILAYQGKAVDTRGYIEQASDLAGSVGGLIEKTGSATLKLALVGGAGYLIYLFLKHKGILKHA